LSTPLAFGSPTPLPPALPTPVAFGSPTPLPPASPTPVTLPTPLLPASVPAPVISQTRQLPTLPPTPVASPSPSSALNVASIQAHSRHPPSTKKGVYIHKDYSKPAVRIPYVEGSPVPLDAPLIKDLKLSYPSALNSDEDFLTYNKWRDGEIPHWVFCKDCFNGRVVTAQGMKGHQFPFGGEVPFLQHLSKHRLLSGEEKEKIDSKFNQFSSKNKELRKRKDVDRDDKQSKDGKKTGL